MLYAALSEEAAAATADAVRAWSDVLLAWSAIATTPTADGALERWTSFVEAGARAQEASARAAVLAGSGSRFAASPFGVTGMFAAAMPPGAGGRAADAPAPIDGFHSLAKPLGRADDLTRIKGVGAKMQEKLNALGVFHFWQLASMSKDVAERLDGALSAGGRVLRDSWIAQAKRLAEDVPA
jgi:predicted flap endonuclease-1-like 5' DNA nuclease